MRKVDYPKVYLYRRVVKAKLFIDQNYHEPINLDAISGKAFFSSYHFIRLFKKIYGKTPHQYLTGVRIDKAKMLLRTAMPIQQVCFAIGFDSVGSFSTLFKRITTLTPSQFQNQQLQRSLEISNTPLKFIPNCFAEQNGWTKNSNFEEV
ncbi:MAG TPA: AraC family transcriptional regulator [Mucilaginibacter sp.]